MLKVELTEQEWTHLLNCASLAPYREVQPVIQKVMSQLVAQKEQPIEAQRNDSN